MDWSNEDYVKVYRRETDDDLMLSWQALALWRAMLLKFDRSGMLETRRGVRGLAALVRMPADVVEAALPELLQDGRLEGVPAGYFAPNFLAAQEASKSDRLRQRESRERRAANARVTNRDQTSQHVTSGHESSQVVTLTSADPLLRKPDPDPEKLSPRAIPPTVADRTAIRAQLRAELEEARLRAATARGVAINPLLAFDRGIDSDLTGHLALAATPAALAATADQARHAIAMAELEVTHGGKSFEWFTGAIFSGGNFARLAGMTADDARRARDPPSRKGGKSIHVGRVEPLPSDQYTEIGDQKI